MDGNIRKKPIELIRRLIHRLGIDIVKYHSPRLMIPPDIDPETAEIIRKVHPYTMSSPERIASLCEAVRYVVCHCIPGDFVECGVWKGGSMMAVAYTLLALNQGNRDLYLYDTFSGMSSPTERDVSFEGIPAKELLKNSSKEDRDRTSVWCYTPLDEVKQVMKEVGYSQDHIHYIEGKVEDTIPASAPKQISLLRLDTDWYESTRHELIHLFPRISQGGVIIIDDYGHWLGARQAVDEYLHENNIRLLLNRIDYTARIGVVNPAGDPRNKK